MTGNLELKLRISADGTAAVTGIRQVSGEVERLGPAAQRAQQQGVGPLGAGVQKLGPAASLAHGAVAKLGAAIAGLAAVRGLAGWFADAVVASERMGAALLAITGTSAGVRAEMDYLYSTASRLGLGIGAAADAYISLSAAAKGTSLEGKAARDIFESVSLAMAKLGKSSADTKGALLAIEQMISKGTVSAEELRGQLGERLPGAFQAAARAMETTTEGLGEMLAKGQVAAEQMIPRLAAELNRLYDDGKRVGTVTAEWARLTNEFTRAAAALNDMAGLTSKLSGMLGGVADWMASWRAKIAGAPNLLETANLGDLSTRLQELDSYAVQAAEHLAQLGRELEGAGGRRAGEIRQSIEAAKASLSQIRAEQRQLRGMQEENEALMRDGLDAAGRGISEYAAKATAILSQYIDKGMGGVAERLTQLEPIFDRVAKTIGIPKEVVVAVGVMESRLQELAVSGAGAAGAMQFIGSTAQAVSGQMKAAGVATYSAKEIQTDYTAAITAGAFHLNDLIEKYGSLRNALVAYNAGPKALEWAKLPPETKDYIERLVPAIAAMTREFHDAAAAEKILEGETKKLGKAFVAVGASEPSLAGLARAVEELGDQYLPAERNAKRFEAVQKLLNVAVATGTTSQERATAILAGMAAQMEQTGQAAEDMGIKIPTVAQLWVESVKNMAESIQRELGDAFQDLFDGTIRTAKDAMDRLKDVVISSVADLAAALVMRPVNVLINGVMGTAAAGAAGSAAAGTTGATGGGGFGLSGIGSWFSGNSMGEAIATAIGEGFRYLGANPPSWVSSGAFNLAGTSNLALGGGALAGGLLGNYLFGDKGYGAIGSSIGSTAGAVIGSMILPGIGTVVGGLLGGAGGGWLGSLFGGGKEERPLVRIDERQGRFIGVDAQAISNEAAEQMQAMIGEVNRFLDQLVGLLGPGAEAARAGQTRKAPQALAPEQVGPWLEKVVKDMIGTDLLPNMGEGLFAELVRESWAASQGNMQQFVAEVGALKAMSDALPQIVEQLTAAGLTLGADAERTAVALLRMAGSVEALSQAQAGLDDLFMSATEKQAAGVEALQRAFAGLGLALPGSRDELEGLVGTLDLTSEAGRQAYLAIAAMAQALGVYYEGLEQAAEQAEQAAQAAQELADALAKMQLSAREAIEDVLAVDDAQRNALEQRRSSAALEALAPGLDFDFAASTLDAFREYVAGYEGGLEAFVGSLGENAGAFAEALERWSSAQAAAVKAAEAAEAARREAAEEAKKKAADRATAYANYLARQAQAQQAALDPIRQWISDTREALAGEMAQTPASLAARQGQFLGSLTGTWRRDPQSIERLTGDADAYLQSVRVRSRDRAEYERTVGLVTAQVEAALQGNRKSSDNPLTNMVEWQRRMVRLLDRWEAVGMPAVRA
jgi:tape measure domain-containing protein